MILDIKKASVFASLPNKSSSFFSVQRMISIRTEVNDRNIHENIITFTITKYQPPHNSIFLLFNLAFGYR